jgi:WhiB family redox-sensing transcriptional regulator
MDWRHRARCRTVDPELFFPDGHSPAFHDQIQAAKAICGLCPVREPCLGWALDTGQNYGIWAGLDEAERRQLRRGRNGKAS